MNKNTLIEILKEKSMSFTEEEVNMLIDAELEKGPSEMDTELIDYCLDLLDGKIPATENGKDTGDAKNEVKAKRIKLGKILLLIAIIAIILAIAIPVGGKLVRINAADDMVKYNTDHFSIDLNGSEESIDDIISSLEEEGIENAILPQALLGDDYEIYEVQGNNEKRFYFENEKIKIFGNIIIRNSDGDFDSLIGKYDANGVYSSAEQIQFNGIEILVFEGEQQTFIAYINNNIEYIITLNNCRLETAIEIANTIGEYKGE
ncbi:MAG: hypothetical protein ACI4RF_04790 [Eubacterium sp.]